MGIPGTGLYDVTTLSSGRSSRRKVAEEVTSPPVMGENEPRPNLFSSKAERALHAFFRDIYGYDDSQDGAVEVVSGAKELMATFPKLKAPLELIIFLHGIRDDVTEDEADAMAMELWNRRAELFNDRFVRKYFQGLYPSVGITNGIFTSGKYDVQTLGFLVSEVLQGQKKYNEAIEVLTAMRPDQLVGISLADIEISAGDYDGAIETTEDIENIDDATAMMLVLRGIAFREKGLDDGAIECFKRAIAKKDRSEGVIHRALYERAMTYKKLGKKSIAKKDLEKILVDDPQASGVNEALAGL
jgi:tetratricopeptide (TPR) repeat protein